MRARINLNTDPTSLTVLAADGKEHEFFELNDGKIVEVALVICAEPPLDKDNHGHP